MKCKSKVSASPRSKLSLDCIWLTKLEHGLLFVLFAWQMATSNVLSYITWSQIIPHTLDIDREIPGTIDNNRCCTWRRWEREPNNFARKFLESLGENICMLPWPVSQFSLLNIQCIYLIWRGCDYKNIIVSWRKTSSCHRGIIQSWNEPMLPVLQE